MFREITYKIFCIENEYNGQIYQIEYELQK